MEIDLGKDQPANANAYVAVAIGFSVIVALVVFGFGWFSKKRVLWVYGIGMGLYLLDGLLYLLLQDFASVAFHAFALFSMFGGWSAFRKLAKQEDDDLPDDDEDQDDDTV